MYPRLGTPAIVYIKFLQQSMWLRMNFSLSRSSTAAIVTSIRLWTRHSSWSGCVTEAGMSVSQQLEWKRRSSWNDQVRALDCVSKVETFTVCTIYVLSST